MDIIVEGRAKKNFKADKISIKFDFITNRETYECAVDEGTKNIETFLLDVLNKMNFTKDDLKTESFRVYEDTKYDYEKKEYIKNGFTYSQSSVLEFDYSAEMLAKMIAEISRFENPPKYVLKFGLKDEETAKKEVLAEAYTKAKMKAEVIANVAGKNLKDCVKTDFRPFSQSVISDTHFDTSSVMYKSARLSKEESVENAIQNVFTPKDIEISETLYCLWLAE